MQAICGLLLLTFVCFCQGQYYRSGSGDAVNDTEIEDIRLWNDGSYGEHMGRVEVLYNGTWGTVCDNHWGYSDAMVVCRMLGYDGVVCPVYNARFGRADSTVPTWMSNLRCRGNEFSLDHCRFQGWGVRRCSHRDDAGVICADPNIVAVAPTNVTLLDSTTSSLTVGFIYDPVPHGNFSNSVQFFVRIQSESRSYPDYRYYTLREQDYYYNFTILNLVRDTEYEVQVQAQVLFAPLCYGRLAGNFSDIVTFHTNATRKPSNVPVRLVSPEHGLDFMGRVEVFHDGEWGTVCDDNFYRDEANVICGMLNYTRAACAVRQAQMGRGSGTIWLDDLDCRAGDERIEDCDHRSWGDSNCHHNDDVGVICMHDYDDYLINPVQNVTVVRVGARSVTISWNNTDSPRLSRVRVSYYVRLRQGSRLRRTSTVYPTGNELQFTFRGLQFSAEYNITVQAQLRFSYSGCYNIFHSSESESVTVTTRETAPTQPPRLFHVVVINTTAIEAQWNLPPYEERNGIIRGYILLYSELSSGREEFINITSNETMQYIIGGLQPGTAYSISVLAYTVANGPRTLHLVAVTTLEGSEPCVNRFGLYGDGLDRVVKYPYNRDVRVHCGSSYADTQIDWFFANGTKVGITNRNFREGHYPNGTTVLQIASSRGLSFCDGGVFTCVANCTKGVEKKNFTLVIGTTPVAPSQPTQLLVRSSSITIGWEENECNGGHLLRNFELQYSESFYRYSSPTFTIRLINPSRRNYTIDNLTPNTRYMFRVRAFSVNSRYSSYSVPTSITTLPRGPSPPRDVVARLISPYVAEVTWREPATPNGVIVLYTIHAMVFLSEAGGQHTTIRKVFPRTARAGNFTFEGFAHTYQFRVTASIQATAGHLSEGELSPLTPNSVLFVPTPGLPTPQNVSVVETTNATIDVSWDYPPPPFEPIQQFKVAYFSQVEWRSGGGNLVQFAESNEVMTTHTRVRLVALTPGTRYQIKVSAITQRGQGAEVTTYGTTEMAPTEHDRVAYFQVRLGPVVRCLGFQSKNISSQLVTSALVNQLQTMCRCNLTVAHIKDQAFSCSHNLQHLIVFRARVIGTENYSAGDLVELLQSWIGSKSAAITVDFSRLHLDSTCPTSLDTSNSPDCPLTPQTQTHAPPTQTTTMQANPGLTQTTPQRTESVGGVVVGSIIAVLLLALIGLVVVILVVKFKPKVSASKKSEATKRFSEEDEIPFSDIHESNMGSGILPQEKSDIHI